MTSLLIVEVLFVFSVFSSSFVVVVVVVVVVAMFVMCCVGVVVVLCLLFLAVVQCGGVFLLVALVASRWGWTLKKIYKFCPQTIRHSHPETSAPACPVLMVWGLKTITTK